MDIPEEVLHAYKITKGKRVLIEGVSNKLIFNWTARKSAKVNGPISNKFG